MVRYFLFSIYNYAYYYYYYEMCSKSKYLKRYLNYLDN